MSKKKIVLIVVSIVLIFFTILCGLSAYYIFGAREKISYDIKEWSNLEKLFTYLPSVDEMGEYTDLKVKHLHKDYFIFQSDAYTLRVTYSMDIFDEQKNVILNNYSFQETVVDYGDKTIVKNTHFTFDTFQFQMLSLKEYNLYYPKQIVFVGISEKNNEIAVVFFDDLDLDYISDSFEDFLVKECGWE